MTLPTADWLAALADMDAAIAAALAAHDAACGVATPQAAITFELEEKLSNWDDRLAAAGRLAEELEREFHAQAAAVARWAEAFTGWRERIQQPASPA